MLKKILAGGTAVALLSYVGLSLYVLRDSPLDDVVLCAADEPGLYIPSTLCRGYLRFFSQTYSEMEKSNALTTTLALYSSANDTTSRERVLSQAAKLLDYGANIDSASPYDGLLPLHAAVVSNEPGLIRHLLNMGANPALKDKRFQKTPGDLAAWLEETKRLDRQEVIRALNEQFLNGGDVGSTPQ